MLRAAARRDGEVPRDVIGDLIEESSRREDVHEIALSADNAQIAYVHIGDAVSALIAAGSPGTATGRTYRATTWPGVTFAEIGRMVVAELAAIGVAAAVVSRRSPDPIILCPSPSHDFRWRPLLASSRETVRAALWQYLGTWRKGGDGDLVWRPRSHADRHVLAPRLLPGASPDERRDPREGRI